MSTPPFALRPWMALLLLSPALALAQTTGTQDSSTELAATQVTGEAVQEKPSKSGRSAASMTSAGAPSQG